jgi:predicted DNA-binding WGR domain protein
MMTSIRLERQEPARNIQRFYAITVTRTLFDGWALVREWGRIGQPGTVREMWYETETAAVEAGMKVRQRKVKRGYHVVGG